MNTKRRTITFLPDGKQVTLSYPSSILTAASKAGVKISQRCGGKAGCLMCKVTVEEGSIVSPINQKEKLKLGSLVERGVRLACQTQAIGDVTVNVPEDPLKALIRAKLEGKTDEWD
jgi:2Fe-2S ferredoxin